jgi:hypothetical protein
VPEVRAQPPGHHPSLASFSHNHNLDTSTTPHQRSAPSLCLHYHITNTNQHPAPATMVQDQGLDVYLAPFSNIVNRYEQHAVPAGSPNFTGDPNEVYIEAVDGERFMLVVDLLKDFDMKGATHLRILQEIDQARNGSGRVSYGGSDALKSYKPNGTNLKGRHALSTTDRKVNGAWSECGFVFATLVTGDAPTTAHEATLANNKADEELEMAADEVAQDVDMHGKIVITVWRGFLKKNAVRAKKLWTDYDAPDTKVSSKEVVKDSRVSHAVR